MATILQVEISASRTALAKTVELLPRARYELETTVASYADCTWSGVWISGYSQVDIGAALYNDPTVTEFECLNVQETASLYRIDLDKSSTTLQEILQKEGGVVLSGVCKDRQWNLQIRFNTRSQLSQAYQRMEERRLEPTVHGIVESTDETLGKSGLTKPQWDAVVCAIEHGYFEIPRQISMEELAAKLDITHQALSERLRRAYETLIAAELDAMRNPRVPAEIETD